jgi:hypothetical protein
MTITIRMRLVKEHKTLVEYAECDLQGVPVKKPFLSPIYIRKNGETLPAAYTVSLTPLEG